MSGDYEVYICPGCGVELNAYDIEPSSISDAGAPRREETGNYFCGECERDYEPIPVVPVSMSRTHRQRDELLSAVRAHKLASERVHGDPVNPDPKELHRIADRIEREERER